MIKKHKCLGMAIVFTCIGLVFSMCQGEIFATHLQTPVVVNNRNASTPKITEDIEVNADHFPDDAFRNYLLNQYGNIITQSEIASIDRLYIYGKGIKNLEGIQYFTNLAVLDCSSNALTSLDVSQNTELEILNCSQNEISQLDLKNNTKLTEVACYEGYKLKSIDISQCPDLTKLRCYGNILTSLDISKNTKLTSLECFDNKITALDTSQNMDLEELLCTDNQISTLDLSHNSKLYYLECENNDLTYLNVRGCDDLMTVYGSFNRLTSLDLSQNINLSAYDAELGYQSRTITVSTDTYDLKNIDPNIDVTKIKNLTGAALIGTVLKDYVNGTPVKYNYSCGNGIVMPVTLNIKQQMLNEWTESLSIDNWQYGQPASQPHAAAKYGTPIYTYSHQIDGTYSEMVPTEAGTYYVKATVEPTSTYSKLESTPIEFKIEKAVNEWTTDLDIEDWTYLKDASSPNAKALYGNESIQYLYSNEIGGQYVNEVPTEAGIWYVKASIEETSNYEGLSAIKQFEIKKAVSSYIIPTNLKGIVGDHLADIVLPMGFEWMDDTLVLENKGLHPYKAKYVPTDSKNYQIIENIEIIIDIADKPLILPEITIGAETIYQIESGQNIVVVCSADLADLTGIFIDEQLVDAAHYILKSGSTILILKAEYLDTLDQGWHTLRFAYGHRSAKTKFKIIAKSTDPIPQPPMDSPNEPTDSKQEPNDPIHQQPSTGDRVHVKLYATVLCMSGLLILALKYKEKQEGTSFK